MKATLCEGCLSYLQYEKGYFLILLRHYSFISLPTNYEKAGNH